LNLILNPTSIRRLDFDHRQPYGARGIGEIGITGGAAAVANAVYHATGKRIRELPITLDKLFGSTVPTGNKFARRHRRNPGLFFGKHRCVNANGVQTYGLHASLAGSLLFLALGQQA